MDNKDWKQSHARTDRDGIEPYQPGREPPLLAELSQCQSISEKIPNGRWRKAPSRRPAPEDLHLLSVSVFRTKKRLRPDEDWQIPTAPWSRSARSSGDRRASIRNLLKVGLAHSERFELPTLGIEIRCSIQLSYECIKDFNGLAERSKFLALFWLTLLTMRSDPRGCRPRKLIRT